MAFFSKQSLFEKLDDDVRALARLINERFPEVPEDDVVSMWWNDVQKIRNVNAPTSPTGAAAPSASAVVEPVAGPSTASDGVCGHLFTKGHQAGTVCGAKVKDGGMVCNKHKKKAAVKAVDKPAVKAVAASEGGVCRHPYTKGSKAGKMCGIKVKDGGDRCSKHRKKEEEDEVAAEAVDAEADEVDAEADDEVAAEVDAEVDAEADEVAAFDDDLADALADLNDNDFDNDFDDEEEPKEEVKAPPKKAKAKAPSKEVVTARCKHVYTKKGGTRSPGDVCGAKVKDGTDFCGKHKKK